MKTSFRWFVYFVLSCCIWASASVDEKKAVIPALSNADCEKFGRSLAADINQGQPQKILEQLDCTALGERTVQGLNFGDADRAGFVQSFSESFKKSFGKQIGDWQNARYIRTTTTGGQKRVLMRVIANSGALNFVEWVCVSNGRGGVKTVDFFSFVTAELVSETSRRGVLPYVAEKQRGIVARLTKGESAYVRAFPKFSEAVEVLQSGDADKALGILEALPDEVKVTPFCLLIRLQVAQKADEKVYVRVIEEWEKARPGDPSLDLVSIDGCIMRKDYDGCVRRIEALQKRVGGDGYLQAMKANVYTMAGSIDKAGVAIREAIAQEPTMANSYDIWFNIELQAKN